MASRMVIDWSSWLTSPCSSSDDRIAATSEFLTPMARARNLHLQLEPAAPDAVVHAQQPPAATLLGRVQAIAGDGLNHRLEKRVAEPVDDLAKPAVARELPLEEHRGHVLDGAVRDLHEPVALFRAIRRRAR